MRSDRRPIAGSVKASTPRPISCTRPASSGRRPATWVRKKRDVDHRERDQHGVHREVARRVDGLPGPAVRRASSVRGRGRRPAGLGERLGSNGSRGVGSRRRAEAVESQDGRFPSNCTQTSRSRPAAPDLEAARRRAASDRHRARRRGPPGRHLLRDEARAAQAPGVLALRRAARTLPAPGPGGTQALRLPGDPRRGPGQL